MTAFFKDVRSGEFCQPPPVAHDVAAVVRGDVLVALDQEKPPEHAGIQQLLRPAVNRRVAQDESGGKHPAAPPLRLGDLLAGIDGGGQRFFSKDILSGGEGGEDVIPVAGVRGKHHHPVDAGSMNRLFRRRGRQRIGTPPDFAQRLVEQRPVRIEGGNHPDRPTGITQQIFDHVTCTVSRSEHRNAESLFHDPLSFIY